MIHEFHDYRPEPPKKELGSWPFWASPEHLAFDYVLKIGIVLILMPMLFGVKFTPIGYFLNFLLVDFLIYLQYKKLSNLSD